MLNEKNMDQDATYLQVRLGQPLQIIWYMTIKHASLMCISAWKKYTYYKYIYGTFWNNLRATLE